MTHHVECSHPEVVMMTEARVLFLGGGGKRTDSPPRWGMSSSRWHTATPGQNGFRNSSLLARSNRNRPERQIPLLIADRHVSWMLRSLMELAVWSPTTSLWTNPGPSARAQTKENSGGRSANPSPRLCAIMIAIKRAQSLYPLAIQQFAARVRGVSDPHRCRFSTCTRTVHTRDIDIQIFIH
jgi:hypothetical protein